MVYTGGPGPLAQWSELAAHTRSVAGSSPAGPTIPEGGLPSRAGRGPATCSIATKPGQQRVRHASRSSRAVAEE